MAAITPCTCRCTADQSISGSGRRMPKRNAPRAAVTACDAARSALLGTQPKFRQSPPMRSRSISVTRSPSWAATAVTDRPAAPAPMTARSTSGIRTPPLLPCDRQQRQHREADERTEDTGREDDAHVRHAAFRQYLADTGPDGGIDKGGR